MTKEQVKQIEQLNIIEEEENALFYLTSVGGLDCFLAYNFVENQLYNAVYWIIEEHTSDNLYIEDYHKLKNMLIQKYGTPLIDDEFWKSSLYKNTPAYKGLAISIGDLIMSAKWETENTSINIVLWGDNFEIKHAINYQSKEFGPKAEEQKEQSELDKL